MKPSAAKRGRNPSFPYVPIVVRADGTSHNTNAAVAYATRQEAVDHAQRWIDTAQSVWAAQELARAKRHGEG